MLVPVKLEHRGAVTDELKKFYHDKTQRELTVRELRLLPFILHCVLNGGRIASGNLNSEEIQILDELYDANFIFYRQMADTIAVTTGYYDIICEVLKHSYLTQAVEA